MRIPSAVVEWKDSSTNISRQIWLLGSRIHIESLARMLGGVRIFLENELTLHEQDEGAYSIAEYVEFLEEPLVTAVCLDWDWLLKVEADISTVIRPVRSHPNGVFPIVVTSFCRESDLLRRSLGHWWLKSPGCTFLPKPFGFEKLIAEFQKEAISEEQRQQVLWEFGLGDGLVLEVLKQEKDLNINFNQFLALMSGHVYSLSETTRRAIENTYQNEPIKETIEQYRRKQIGHNIHSMIRGAAELLKGAINAWERRHTQEQNPCQQRLIDDLLESARKLGSILRERQDNPDDKALLGDQKDTTDDLRGLLKQIRHSNQPKRVLLVDDEHVRSGWGIVLQVALKLQDCEVACIPEREDPNRSAGEIEMKMFESIQESEPDLIFLDLKLEQESTAAGLDILKRLYEDEAWFHLPTIVLTAYHDTTFHEQSRMKGAIGSLVKELREDDRKSPYTNLRKVFNKALDNRDIYPFWKRIRELENEIANLTDDDLKGVCNLVKSELRLSYFFLTVPSAEQSSVRWKLLTQSKSPYPEAVIQVGKATERIVNYLVKKHLSKIEVKLRARCNGGIPQDHEKIGTKARILHETKVIQDQKTIAVAQVDEIMGKRGRAAHALNPQKAKDKSITRKEAVNQLRDGIQLTEEWLTIVERTP